ncbi:MAG TPA: hypothetical protein VKX29_02960 [Brumimicrobium sp.]|nr:hypothetical protein [Brumimicrobium sp.]
MKILNNLPNGGFKTFSDDLRFMTEINKDAFEMLTAALSDLHSVIILKGCEISTTGSNTVVTPGVILMHNELLAFNGLTFPTPTGGDVAYWSTEDVVLKSRAFQAGNMEDVHIDKVARIEVGGSVPSGSLAIDETKRYWEVVTANIIKPNWQPLPESTHEFPSVGAEARFLMDNSGFVRFSGFFTNADPVGMNIGRLPVGYRPTENFEFIHISSATHTSAYFNKIRIQTDGYIVPVDNNIGQVVNLNMWPSFKAN